MFSSNQVYLIRKSLGINIYQTQKRWKTKKEHWSVVARKKKSTDRALEYFDDFYKQVFNTKWPSVRLGLLTENKYCAVVNNYSDTDRIERELESLGAINVKNLIQIQFSHKDSKMWQRKLNQVNKLDQSSELRNKQQTVDGLGSPELKLADDSTRSGDDRIILPSQLGHADNSSALYDFVPATRLKGMEDYVPESHHFSYYKKGNEDEFSVQVETEDRLGFPDTLKIYSFETGNTARFPKPKRGSTGVTDYYLLDGSSILPVLSLGLEPGDRVLDMCSAPGGKSLLCLQTLLTSKLVSNDSSLSRLNRLKRVLNEFFYDLPKKEAQEEIVVLNSDARELSHLGTFNKILVDVPCTTDRYSLLEDDNNIFRPDRIKERIKLPELQTDILTSALKQVEDGGTVVYSTCSLSPVQNDGVVQMALKRIWQETNDTIIVKDMSRVLTPYNILYRFAHNIGLRYGNLVIPYLPSNFGPMYFCKLVKRNKH